MVDGVTMVDWNEEWGDDDEGWSDVLKQEPNATVPTGTAPATVTGPVAPAAATEVPAAVTGATAAVTAYASAVTGATTAVTRPTAEVDGTVDASGSDGGHRGGHGGLAFPQPPSHGGHGGYRGAKVPDKAELLKLRAGEFTFANLVFTERRGLTSAAHVTERVAYIATDRKDDLIAGLQAKAGVKFVHRPHSVKSEAGRQGRGFLKRSTYRCQHGPTDDTKSPEEAYAAIVATRAAATASGKIARVATKTNDGRGLKIGCQCSFRISQLAADPDVSEVVAPRWPHTSECGAMRAGLSQSIQAGRARTGQAIT